MRYVSVLKALGFLSPLSIFSGIGFAILKCVRYFAFVLLCIVFQLVIPMHIPVCVSKKLSAHGIFNIFSIQNSYATLLGGQDRISGPGRPRMRKQDNNRANYFSLGIGFAPWTQIRSLDGLGFTESQMSIIKAALSPDAGIPAYKPTAFLEFGFGGILIRYKQFMLRLYGSLAIGGYFFAIPGTITYPSGDSGTKYGSVNLTSIPMRFLIEPYFSWVHPERPFSIFIGVGIGIVYQLNLVNGLEQGSSSSSTTNPTQTNIFSSAASFLPVFTGAIGGTWDVTQGFSLELKVRYVHQMNRFGSPNFATFSNSVEIVAVILMRA